MSSVVFGEGEGVWGGLPRGEGSGYGTAGGRMKTQTKRICLINPKTPENFWAMQGTLDVVGGRKTLMPNSALLTLAALTPKELGIEYVFCDENLGPVRLDQAYDLVAITGYTLQGERMKELSDAFRARGIASRAARCPSAPKPLWRSALTRSCSSCSPTRAFA